MIFPTGYPPSASLRSLRLPRRKRRWRNITSWVLISVVWLRIQMPSPGAVWPAIVIYGLDMVRSFSSVIMPETRKITIRGPLASIASRKLPGPSSLRLVTLKILPPRPPGVNAPAPSAPGNAGIAAFSRTSVSALASGKTEIKNTTIHRIRRKRPKKTRANSGLDSRLPNLLRMIIDNVAIFYLPLWCRNLYQPTFPT